MGFKLYKRITKDELIAALQEIPGNPEVMINAGERGPSRLRAVRLVTVNDEGRREMNWEVMYPEVPADEDESPRITVILLD
jgi:hypothetical protein